MHNNDGSDFFAYIACPFFVQLTASIPNLNALNLFIPIQLEVDDMFGSPTVDFIVGFDFDIDDMRNELLVCNMYMLWPGATVRLSNCAPA